MTSALSGSALARRASTSLLPLASGRPGSASASSSSAVCRYLSTSAATRRNLPARRPLDPLDTAPNAVRHRLDSGETFIVRPAPSAPTLRTAIDAGTVPPSAEGTQSPSSALTQSLFPGFSSAARAPAGFLPPALKPHCRPASAATTSTLTPEQISELRELRLSTAASSTPGSDTSVRALAERFGVSQAFVRIIAPLPTDVRKSKLAEAEERSGREFWGFNKRLARFERRVRREMW
ncbi:unnamed protein product [Tilletia controversa]|uniref:Uncharacterized protein n=2 Tax=Tilletia TaxID=13289 RepID=A0A177UV93_9BASI|nr:hypothetical protein CF336_g9283 [Tilletia laevis]KAE8180708.1 hypothetical protein CF328_g9078 [Tilletia controversa]KAE8237487.1 hypothetical protein A4X03_0g9105 [Tilletia caries]KAE8180913.1 hypothetical protein CF335_g9108 [Tilletia laevis]CAD6891348.1 unnamed protein product [Tilletia caries]